MNSMEIYSVETGIPLVELQKQEALFWASVHSGEYFDEISDDYLDSLDVKGGGSCDTVSIAAKK